MLMLRKSEMEGSRNKDVSDIVGTERLSTRIHGNQ